MRRGYRINPAILQMLMAGAMVTELGRQFVIFTLLPWCSRWTSEMNCKVVPRPYFVRFELFRISCERSHGLVARTPYEFRRRQTVDQRDASRARRQPPRRSQCRRAFCAHEHGAAVDGHGSRQGPGQQGQNAHLEPHWRRSERGPAGHALRRGRRQDARRAERPGRRPSAGTERPEAGWQESDVRGRQSKSAYFV